MRQIAIGFAVVSLLIGGVSCKKKPADKKDQAASGMADDMRPAAMDPGDDMQPDKRPATQTDKQPVADADEKPPVDKEAVPEGVLSGVKGTVEIRKAGTAEFTAAKDDDKVFAKDSVRVGKDGEATLSLWDNSSVELTPESAITVNVSAAIKNPSPSVTVMAGAARFDVAARTEGQGTFSVYTPAAAVAVQGTVLAVGVGLTGNARVAVEEGKVELTPVVKVDAKPVALPAGRVVVVPMGKVPAAPKPYKPETAGWDEWLEAEGTAAAKNPDAVAKLHSSEVEQLDKDANSLEGAEDKDDTAAAELEKKVAAAQQAKKVAEYKKYQPQLASLIERRAAVAAHLRMTHGRRYAHAYLLGLLAGRLEGGVYKADAARKKAVLRHYQRIEARDRTWRLRRYKRLIRKRRRLRRYRRDYYLHHAEGRLLAPKLKVKVPDFYRRVKLRRRLRRARIVVDGYNRPLYRRRRYRGKRRKLMAAGLYPRTKAWYRHKKWQERRKKRFMRQKAKRALWRKAVIKRRRARWAKRPAYRQRWRTRVRAWRMKRRAMRRGMMHGMGPHGRMHGMGPHGMRFGMRLGMGPHGMGPHGMGPRGMRFGMRMMRRDAMRLRRLRRKLRRERRKAMGM